MFSLKCDVPVPFTGSRHQRMRQGWGKLLGLVFSQGWVWFVVLRDTMEVVPIPCACASAFIFCPPFPHGCMGCWRAGADLNSKRSALGEFSEHICPHIQVTHSSDVPLSHRPWEGQCAFTSVSWVSSQGPTSYSAQEVCRLHWLMLYSFNVLHKKLSLGISLQFLLSH